MFNDLNEDVIPSAFSFGVSMAASWAWAGSLVVAMTFLVDMGQIPFLIWAFANSFAILLFGFVMEKLPHMRTLLNNFLVRIAMIIVQFFVIWMNMQSIFQLSQQTGWAGETGSRVLALLVGVLFCSIVLKRGLRMSIFTDKIQWGVMIAGGIMVFLLALRGGTPAEGIHLGLTPEGLRWAWYGSLLLLAGPLMDLQKWQRARFLKEEHNFEPFLWGALMFGLYMFIFYLAFLLDVTGIGFTIILLVGLMASSSSIDSAAIAFNEVGNPKIGFAIAFLAVLSWPLVAGIGALGLWGIYGSFRLYVIIVLIGISLYRQSQGIEVVNSYFDNENKDVINNGIF